MAKEGQHSWKETGFDIKVCRHCRLKKITGPLVKRYGESSFRTTRYVAPSGIHYDGKVPYPCLGASVQEKLQAGERLFDGILDPGAPDAQARSQALYLVLDKAVRTLSEKHHGDLPEKVARKLLRNAAEDLCMALTGKKRP